jgi:hypothetical protein
VATGGTVGAVFGAALGASVLSKVLGESVKQHGEEFFKLCGEHFGTETVAFCQKFLGEIPEGTRSRLEDVYSHALRDGLKQLQAEIAGLALLADHRFDDWFCNWDRALSGEQPSDLRRISKLTSAATDLSAMACAVLEDLDAEGAQILAGGISIIHQDNRALPEPLAILLEEKLPPLLDKSFCELLLRPEYEAAWKETQLRLGTSLRDTLEKIRHDTEEIRLEQEEIKGDLRKIVSSLASLSDSARRLPPRVGSVLEISQIANAGVVQRRDAVGESVQWGRLLDGLYAPRPALLEDALRSFLKWTSTIQSTLSARRLPVFWIDGRSGDGKSVLLFQLAAALLSSCNGYALYQATWADSLPDVIDHAQNTVDDEGLILILVEDLHLVSNQEAFRAAMRVVLDHSSLRVAVLACGPSPERSSFLRVNRFVNAHTWTVPALTDNDLDTFDKWFETPITTTEALERANLVEVLFTSQVGSPIRSFADHFGKRLSELNVFDTARKIAAVNALDIAAPNTIFKEGERDIIERLAQDDQLHFEWLPQVWGDGVRLGHGRIAWSLFEEWSTDPLTNASLSKSLARAIVSTLNLPQLGEAFANQLLTSASRKLPTLLGSSLSDSQTEVARFFEFLIESTCTHPFARSVAIRAALAHLQDDGVSAKVYNVNVLDLAVAAAHDDQAPPSVRAIIAAQLALLGKQGKIVDAHFREDAESLILSDTVGPSSMGALAMLLRTGVSSMRLLESWLTSFPEVLPPRPFLKEALKRYGAIRSLVSAAQRFIETHWEENGVSILLTTLLTTDKNTESLQLATKWLAAHHESCRAADVLSVLLRVHSSNRSLPSLAKKWIEIHKDTPGAINLLSVLLNNTAPDNSLRSLGVEVLTAHWDRPSGANLLCPMLHVFGEDEDVLRIASDWIRHHWNSPMSSFPISSYLHATKGADFALTLALDWIESHPLTPASCPLLGSILNIGGEKVWLRTTAIEWLKKNSDIRAVSDPLASLLVYAADDERIVPLTFGWVQSHGEWDGASQLLSALLNSSPDNGQIIAAARSWICSHPEEQGTSQLLSTLIKVAPSDEQVSRIAINWVESHAETTAAAQLICSLLDSRSSNEEIRALSWAWIDNNGHRPFEQQQLLAAMLRVEPLERQAFERALTFLRDRELDKVPGYLFPALAAVAPSDPEVVALLSRLIENEKVEVGLVEFALNEWLAASDPTYSAVHAICRARNSYTTRGKQLFGVHIRCCARNYGAVLNAIRLGGARAEDLCHLIEKGLPSIEVDPAGLIQTCREWPKDGAYHIWKGVLRSDYFQPDLFIEFLNEWLDSNVDTREYREVLSDIKLRTMIDPAFEFRLTERVRWDVHSVEVVPPTFHSRRFRKAHWLDRSVP